MRFGVARFLAVFLITMSMLCACSYAQTTNASVTGQITDRSGKLVSGVAVVFTDINTGAPYTTETNNEGIYTLPTLQPGVYRAYITKEGFKSIVKPDVELHVQDQVSINFALDLGSVSETVTVAAGGLSLNTTDASVGTVIDRKFVSNIPLNGRSFQDLISLTPGVVTQSPQSGSALAVNGDFSVNGQRTESNYYTVDGVTANIGSGNGYGGAQNATGGSVGGATALGTTQSLISVDSLQEFRVQSSTYSAEYGRSPGGQFSLVTRSGSNNFHGSLFDYLRNDFFDANDWFNDRYGKPISALRQNDFGGTLGGPVWIPRLYDGKNRTFSFVSYEGLRLTQPTAAAIQYVPDTFMRGQAASGIQPILNAWPVQNGIDYGSAASPSLAQFIGGYSLPSRIDSTSVRIDHILSPKLSLFFRYGDTPSYTEARPYVALARTSINTQTYTLGATSQLSTKLNNEFRLGYDRTNSSIAGTVDGFGGATPINLAAAMGAGGFANPYPVMFLSIAGIGSTDFATPSGGNLGRQWNLVDTLSGSLGRHQVKIGMDYRRIKSPLKPTTVEPFMYFESAQSILSNAPDFPEVLRFVPATPIFNETAVFAQDEWRVQSKLGLSFGVRWEVNPPPTEAHGNDAYTLLGNINDPASLTLAPHGTPLWKTTWLNFAPRLGMAWTVYDRAGMETVVRTGGGVFFDNANQVASRGYTDGLGFEAYKILSSASLPLTLAQLTVPIWTDPPYTDESVYAYPQHLQLPYTLEWNVSVQQALGKEQTFTMSYVGANGRRQMEKQELSIGGLNPNFGEIVYFPGGITSNYQALQLQFQRSVSHGVQALASYTWSHSLDFGSSATAIPLIRGNSDFDVRNNFQGGLSWDLPRISGNTATTLILNNWGLDGRLIARGGFPVPLQGSLFTDPATGNTNYGGLDLVPNQPIYVYGSQYPGDRVINQAAFNPPASGVVGNAPRNLVRGFGAAQVNLAARRDFHLHEALSLQFRAEAFNILNHPNFGYVDPTYTDTTFGQATQMLNQSLGTVASEYQQGGPRSMQFALKLIF